MSKRQRDAHRTRRYWRSHRMVHEQERANRDNDLRGLPGAYDNYLCVYRKKDAVLVSKQYMGSMLTTSHRLETEAPTVMVADESKLLMYDATTDMWNEIDANEFEDEDQLLERGNFYERAN